MFKKAWLLKIFFIIGFVVNGLSAMTTPPVIRNIVFDIHGVLVDMDYSKAFNPTQEDKVKLATSVAQKIMEQFEITPQGEVMGRLIPIVGGIVGNVLGAVIPVATKDAIQKVEYNPQFNRFFMNWFLGFEPSLQDKEVLSARVFESQRILLDNALDVSLVMVMSRLEDLRKLLIQLKGCDIAMDVLLRDVKSILFEGPVKSVLRRIILFTFDCDAHAKIAEPIEETIYLVQQLRAAGYNVFIISNAAKNIISSYMQKPSLAEVFSLFDPSKIIISGKVGAIKPHPEVYMELIKLFGIKFEESVFLDDDIENVGTSICLGMHGILFNKNDFRRITCELRSLGVCLG